MRSGDTRRWVGRMTPRVEIVEVGPRDGLQSVPVTVSTTTKIEFIERKRA